MMDSITPQDILRRMNRLLPAELMKMIKFIGSEADALGMNVFLVGGFVRDLFLERKNYDLDIAVEPDAIKFGRVLAGKMGGALVIHKKFGTSTLVKKWPSWLGHSRHPDNKFKIDIATCRREKYAKPAALPQVKFSCLRDDLYRRDFTINAMAININKAKFGLFIDFFGGLQDLKKGIVKALHDKSFIDDPTRIFRAVRFEQRFAFTIEKHTEYLIKHAVKKDMFSRTQNQRIREELILMLKEKNPEKAVFRMKELHELEFIHSKLVLKKSTKKIFIRLRKCIAWYKDKVSGKQKLDIWLMNLMVMLEELTLGQVEGVLKEFAFTRNESTKLTSYKRLVDKAGRKLSSGEKMLPSQVYALLESFAHEAILCVMAMSDQPRARNRIKKFFTNYNGMKLKIKGHDIKAEGITPGPRYKQILCKVLYQKLDKELRTKKDELAFMRKLIAEGK